MAAERITGLPVFSTPSRIVLAAVIGLVGATISVPANAQAARSTPVSVGVVVPLSVQGGREGFIDAAALAEYTSPTGLLTRELDSVSNTDAAIGVDPMIIASIRLLGSSAPESATEWLDRLGALDNETFALSYADSDVTVGLQAGSPEVVAPTSFDFAIDPALFGTQTVETPDPEQTPAAPGETPALPTSDNLLDWNYTLGTVVWPQANTVTSDDLAILGGAYDTTILNSANVKRSNTGVSASTIGDAATVVTDDEISALFETTIHAESSTEWQKSFDVLAAAVARVPGRSASGGASILLGIDRGGFDTETRLRATLTALDNLSTADTVPFTEISGARAGNASIVESPHTEVRVDLVRSMLDAEKSDAAFATVAENPELITGDFRIRLIAAMAPQWNRYPGGWGAEVENYLADSVTLRSSVSIARSSDLIFGDRGSIPIYVNNDLDQAVTVYITVEPLSPVLTVEDQNFEVVVEPRSQRRAQIPAVSRSNGEVAIGISMHSGADVPVGTKKWVTINVQAGWETPTITILGVAVFVMFVFGIVRSIRRRRKLKAETGSAVIASEPDDK